MSVEIKGVKTFRSRAIGIVALILLLSVEVVGEGIVISTNPVWTTVCAVAGQRFVKINLEKKLKTGNSVLASFSNSHEERNQDSASYNGKMNYSPDHTRITQNTLFLGYKIAKAFDSPLYTSFVFSVGKFRYYDPIAKTVKYDNYASDMIMYFGSEYKLGITHFSADWGFGVKWPSPFYWNPGIPFDLEAFPLIMDANLRAGFEF